VVAVIIDIVEGLCYFAQAASLEELNKLVGSKLFPTNVKFGGNLLRCTASRNPRFSTFGVA
jgi:hypothetical protein